MTSAVYLLSHCPGPTDSFFNSARHLRGLHFFVGVLGDFRTPVCLGLVLFGAVECGERMPVAGGPELGF